MNCPFNSQCIQCPPGPIGPAGSILDYAEFYALMPPNNTVTIAPGTDISFPQDEPTSGSDIVRTSPNSFNLVETGTYLVLSQVSGFQEVPSSAVVPPP